MLARRSCSLSRSVWPNQLRAILNYTTTEANSKKSTSQENVSEKSINNEKVENNVDEEIKKLNQTVTELKEKYQRSLAENENVRTRLRKEINDAKIYGIQSFCKDLLTVADVMKMAVTSIPDGSVSTATDTWKSFYEGICMTDKELHKVFERHGLVVMAPQKGEKFDPNNHEALFESPIEGMDPGMIAHVQRIGYKLKGRTIRPAQVGISGKQS